MPQSYNCMVEIDLLTGVRQGNTRGLMGQLILNVDLFLLDSDTLSHPSRIIIAVRMYEALKPLM